MTDTTQNDLPEFEHDCERCAFFGRMVSEQGQHFDAYGCMQGGTVPTIILRWSSAPADYTSGSHMFGYLTPELQDAARSWFVADPDVQIILQTLKDAGGELPFEQLEHRYYQRGGS